METIAQRYGLSLERVAETNTDALERHIPLDEYRGYLRTYPGEHYRLLAYLSNTTDDALFFDVGTLYGYSALALASNSKNRVISYNIENQLQLAFQDELPNVEFRVGDVLADDQLVQADIILLDTAHEGPFEHLFFEHLASNGYQGLLILDDIHLNPEMAEFWRSIPCAKEDITAIGHWSGTGLVLCREPAVSNGA